MAVFLYKDIISCTHQNSESLHNLRRPNAHITHRLFVDNARSENNDPVNKDSDTSLLHEECWDFWDLP